MNRVRLTLVFTVVMLLAFGIGTQAQINTTTYCGDLSEADCALLTGVDIAPSATFSGEGTIDVTVAGQPFNVALGMNGSYISDSEIVANIKALNSMSPDEVMAQVYESPEALVTFITDFFQIVDSDMTLSLTLPAELTAGLPTDYNVDLWLVDGVAYADLGAFSALQPGLEGVYGIDLVALYGGLFNDPETAEVLEFMFSDNDDMTNQFTMFTDPEIMGEFTSVARLADMEVNGATVAVFETTLDYGAMFQSDAMRDMLTAALEAQFASMAEMGMDDEELEAVDVNAITDLYAAIFDGAMLETQTMIGLDNNYVYSTSVAFNMSIDPAALEDAMVALSGDEDAMAGAGIPPIDFAMDMTITQSGFGDVADVTLPEGAQLVPLGMLGLPDA
jgi:hypothetical protein